MTYVKRNLHHAGGPDLMEGLNKGAGVSGNDNQACWMPSSDVSDDAMST